MKTGRFCLLCNSDISHRNVQAKYCDSQCKQKYIRINNIERYKSYAKKYYSNNAKKRINKAIEWAYNNMDRHLEYQRLWRFKNPEKVKSIRSRCYNKCENPQARTTQQRKWRENNRGKSRIHSINSESKRRAIKNGCKADVLDVNNVFTRDNFTCQCCGRSDVKLHIDHIIPLSKGGDHVMGNLQTLCSKCNLSFGGKLKTIELFNEIRNKNINLIIKEQNYGKRIAK